MQEYDQKVIQHCVQSVFQTQQGQLTLQWLEDLFLRHTVKREVCSGVKNLPELLAFDAGCRHVVITLRDIFENGFAEEVQQTNGEDED